MLGARSEFLYFLFVYLLVHFLIYFVLVLFVQISKIYKQMEWERCEDVVGCRVDRAGCRAGGERRLAEGPLEGEAAREEHSKGRPRQAVRAGRNPEFKDVLKSLKMTCLGHSRS